ncbi:hypothetical protein ACFQ7A_01585 [Streptomyces sp. NPDC056528]|uniref:hypothetical protein n=1 Tax=Streptomyces sp. NPDC056528 TaxID=3345854 RepID=UPI00369ED587
MPTAAEAREWAMSGARTKNPAGTALHKGSILAPEPALAVNDVLVDADNAHELPPAPATESTSTAHRDQAVDPTLINRTAVQLRALADEVPVGPLVRLAMACQGGRHRSVAVAETVSRLVWEA